MEDDMGWKISRVLLVVSYITSLTILIKILIDLQDYHEALLFKDLINAVGNVLEL